MNFDLDAIDTKSLSDAGVDMPVKRMNTDEPLIAKNGKPVSIKLLGPDSDMYREFTRRQVQKRFAKASDTKSLDKIDFEEVESDTLDLLSSCTIGWSNVLDKDGNEIAFTRETARVLYANYPVLREQVDSFVANRANFLRASLVH